MTQIVVLVEEAKRGSKEAKSELLSRFRPLVSRAAVRACPVLEERGDAMQEGYMAVLSAITQYDSDMNIPFEGYVKSKVYNGVWNYCRKQLNYSNRKQVVIDQEEKQNYDAIASIPDNHLGTEQQVEQNELHVCLRQLLKQLTPLQQEVLMELFVKEQTLQQVAQKLGTTCQAVHQIKGRALAQLRKGMGNI